VLCQLALHTVIFFDFFHLVSIVDNSTIRQSTTPLPISPSLRSEQKTERSEEMYQKNNDFSKNSKTETAIVYQTADGKTITLTEKDFSSVTEFLQWKEWSDQDYHEKEKAESRRRKHEFSVDTYPEGQMSGDSDSSRSRLEEQISQRIILHHALETLTTAQYVRFMLYIRGYSVSEIARMDHIHRKNAAKSIDAAKKKLV
jgi:hypothetical protein